MHTSGLRRGPQILFLQWSRAHGRPGSATPVAVDCFCPPSGALIGEALGQGRPPLFYLADSKIFGLPSLLWDFSLIAFVAMLLRFGAYRGVRGRMSKAKKAEEEGAM